MRSMHRVLWEQKHLESASEAVSAQIRITKITAEQVNQCYDAVGWVI